MAKYPAVYRRIFPTTPKIAISFRYLSPEDTIDEVLKENPDNISSILLDNLYNYLLNNPLEGERGGENKKANSYQNYQN